MALARDMVRSGEIDALVPERVWQEISRGLLSPRPDRMAQVLIECGAWSRLWPELPSIALERDRAHALFAQWPSANLAQRWALWCQGATTQQVLHIQQRLRTPTDVADLCDAWCVHQTTLLRPWGDARQACEQLHQMDAQRRPERVAQLIDLANHWADSDQARTSAAQWQRAFSALRSVDAKAIHQQALNLSLRGPEIGQFLMQAQTQAIAASA
jgi:tRNA nucleotidyltransferase (CCA-adding enzyme)